MGLRCRFPFFRFRRQVFLKNGWFFHWFPRICCIVIINNCRRNTRKCFIGITSEFDTMITSDAIYGLVINLIDNYQIINNNDYPTIIFGYVSYNMRKFVTETEPIFILFLEIWFVNRMHITKRCSCMKCNNVLGCIKA